MSRFSSAVALASAQNQFQNNVQALPDLFPASAMCIPQGLTFSADIPEKFAGMLVLGTLSGYIDPSTGNVVMRSRLEANDHRNGTPVKAFITERVAASSPLPVIESASVVNGKTQFTVRASGKTERAFLNAYLINALVDSGKMTIDGNYTADDTALIVPILFRGEQPVQQLRVHVMRGSSKLSGSVVWRIEPYGFVDSYDANTKQRQEAHAQGQTFQRVRSDETAYSFE